MPFQLVRQIWSSKHLQAISRYMKTDLSHLAFSPADWDVLDGLRVVLEVSNFPFQFTVVPTAFYRPLMRFNRLCQLI